jgi:hypothetical protein
LESSGNDFVKVFTALALAIGTDEAVNVDLDILCSYQGCTIEEVRGFWGDIEENFLTYYKAFINDALENDSSENHYFAKVSESVIGYLSEHKIRANSPDVEKYAVAFKLVFLKWLANYEKRPILNSILCLRVFRVRVNTRVLEGKSAELSYDEYMKAAISYLTQFHLSEELSEKEMSFFDQVL